jgi:hypothetical protein
MLAGWRGIFAIEFTHRFQEWVQVWLASAWVSGAALEEPGEAWRGGREGW